MAKLSESVRQSLVTIVQTAFMAAWDLAERTETQAEIQKVAGRLIEGFDAPSAYVKRIDELLSNAALPDFSRYVLTDIQNLFYALAAQDFPELHSLCTILVDSMVWSYRATRCPTWLDAYMDNAALDSVYAYAKEKVNAAALGELIETSFAGEIT